MHRVIRPWHNVAGHKQRAVGQSSDAATELISREHSLTEETLVDPEFDQRLPLNARRRQVRLINVCNFLDIVTESFREQSGALEGQRLWTFLELSPDIFFTFGTVIKTLNVARLMNRIEPRKIR